MKKIIIILLAFVFFGKLIAQNTFKSNKDSGEIPFLSIRSISISVGWYNPSMNYWNRTFLPSTGSSNKFNGNFLYGGNITFNLPYNLGTRAGIWYWQDKVNGGTNASFNSLRIGFTGFSLGVFYRYSKPVVYKISPYAGIDGSYFLIQNKYNIGGDVTRMIGHDVSATPFIGIERTYFQKLVIGLEYGYVVGRYRQNVETINGASNPKVSVNGHKIGLTVGYKFP
jgi:hypothetical protein